MRGRESRGGGTRPRLEPRELLAHGRCPAQSQQAGREVRAPPSQAAGWRLPLETGKASESSPRLLQSRGWAERQPPTCGGEGRGEWRQGLGEADTEVNLPAVLCKTPLSVQCSWHKTRNSHSHSLAHSSPHLRDADSRYLSSFAIITQTLHCGSPGEQRRALLGIFQMCLNKHGSGMEWQE